MCVASQGCWGEEDWRLHCFAPALALHGQGFLKVCWCYSNDDVEMAEGARGGVVSHTDSAVLDHTGHQCCNFLWRSVMRDSLQGAVRSFIARLLQQLPP